MVSTRHSLPSSSSLMPASDAAEADPSDPKVARILKKLNIDGTAALKLDDGPKTAEDAGAVQLYKFRGSVYQKKGDEKAEWAPLMKQVATKRKREGGGEAGAALKLAKTRHSMPDISAQQSGGEWRPTNAPPRARPIELDGAGDDDDRGYQVASSRPPSARARKPTPKAKDLGAKLSRPANTSASRHGMPEASRAATSGVPKTATKKTYPADAEVAVRRLFQIQHRMNNVKSSFTRAETALRAQRQPPKGKANQPSAQAASVGAVQAEEAGVQTGAETQPGASERNKRPAHAMPLKPTPRISCSPSPEPLAPAAPAEQTHFADLPPVMPRRLSPVMPGTEITYSTIPAPATAADHVHKLFDLMPGARPAPPASPPHPTPHPTPHASAEDHHNKESKRAARKRRRHERGRPASSTASIPPAAPASSTASIPPAAPASSTASIPPPPPLTPPPAPESKSRRKRRIRRELALIRTWGLLGDELPKTGLSREVREGLLRKAEARAGEARADVGRLLGGDGR